MFTVGKADLIPKIIEVALAAGLVLAGLLAVVVLAGSILYMSDPGRQDAYLEQQNAQTLSDKAH